MPKGSTAHKVLRTSAKRRLQSSRVGYCSEFGPPIKKDRSSTSEKLKALPEIKAMESF